MGDVSRIREWLTFVEDARAYGIDPRDLQRGVRRGTMIRVRRGVYFSAAEWARLDGRQRHLLSVIAVVQQGRSPALVSGPSAGALWGLPFAAVWPADVSLLVPMAQGGSSEPGVRRSVASTGSAIADQIEGIPVTTLARTALDMARGEEFARAVAILDRAIWREDAFATTQAALEEERLRARFVRRDAHLARAVAFASPLSDSPYESMCRAVIHELGFAPPVLQAELRDAEGVIRPDFLWPGIAAAEFDGKVKYTRDEYTRGDPSEVVWREKRREDRLRRIVPSVVRIVAADVHDRSRLAAVLSHAGIPRERTTSSSTEGVGSPSLERLMDHWPRRTPE
jgi:hypothetical protein